MTYPYGLQNNPYPSSPTPTEEDAEILGGTRHIEAKNAIVECISDLFRKSSRRNSTDNDFRLITMIQDVGAGKTHLALHIKSLKTRQNISSTYVDLATISPKTKESLYDAMIRGFNKEIFEELRQKFLTHVCDRAIHGDSLAKKTLSYSLMDRLKGITIKQKTEDILYDKKSIDLDSLKKFLSANYNKHESVIIKNVIEREFAPISNLEELLGRISALSKLSHNFLNKVILYEIDEFDAEDGSIEFVKSIINAHIPASVMLLIATPSSYADVQKKNPSLFDRLEKANYKIDLAGSNSVDELIEIGLEYIKQSDREQKLTKKEQNDLAAKIRVLCDEFPDFRSVRSIINILYHATEKANTLGHPEITEQAIDETIRSTFPGLKVRGSIMEVPISDFIRILRETTNGKTQTRIKEAISNLVNFAHDIGTIAEPEKSNRAFDAIYSDPYGTKIGISVVMDNNHAKNFEVISNVVKSSAFVDRLVILTNTNIPPSGPATIVNVDKSKIVDLLYFSDRYNDHKITESENDKVQMLAKTVCVI